MARRWRDLWLEIEFQRLANFPRFRLGLRAVWYTRDRAERAHARLATSHGPVPEPQPRRAA